MNDSPSIASAASRTCPNCGAAAEGAYCPTCGQETSLALPTVRSMLREAAGRYVALDGRLWRTLYPLVFKPGFLTREYFAGRRRRYVRPGRLFLVLSIALFALLRVASDAPSIAHRGAIAELKGEIAREMEREPKSEGEPLSGFGPEADARLAPLRKNFDALKSLSPPERAKQIYAGMLRYGPYAAFVLLPLFALLMKVVYVGRARRYPMRPRRYAAHLVFGAHNHAFVFLVCAGLVLIPGGLASTVLIGWAIAYLLWSMKTVYGGRWSGVVTRALLVGFAYSIVFFIVVAWLVVAAVLLG